MLTRQLRYLFLCACYCAVSVFWGQLVETFFCCSMDTSGLVLGTFWQENIFLNVHQNQAYACWCWLLFCFITYVTETWIRTQFYDCVLYIVHLYIPWSLRCGFACLRGISLGARKYWMLNRNCHWLNCSPRLAALLMLVAVCWCVNQANTNNMLTFVAVSRCVWYVWWIWLHTLIWRNTTRFHVIKHRPQWNWLIFRVWFLWMVFVFSKPPLAV